MTIRRAARTDLDALVELAIEFRSVGGEGSDRATIVDGFGGLLGDDTHGVVWVAIDADELVGYAVVTWGWSIEIGGLDVVLDEIFTRRRGTGVGSALIEHLERDCRDRGVKRIFLETELVNDRARRLYERHGYVADTSIWMAKELR